MQDVKYKLCLGYARCEVYVSVALFLLSAGLNTFTVPGCKSTMLDIAPAYSGQFFCHTLKGVFANYQRGYIKTDFGSNSILIATNLPSICCAHKEKEVK